MNLRKTLILILFLLVYQYGFTQQALTGSGGDITGIGGSVSYTVGQTFYQTFTSTSGALEQGVQLPYEILTVGLNQVEQIKLSIQAYPIPTVDILTLSIQGEEYDSSMISYMLIDILGKTLAAGQTEGETTQVTMAGFEPGTYFLRIIKENITIKVFKIIKR